MCGDAFDLDVVFILDTSGSIDGRFDQICPDIVSALESHLLTTYGDLNVNVVVLELGPNSGTCDALNLLQEFGGGPGVEVPGDNGNCVSELLPGSGDGSGPDEAWVHASAFYEVVEAQHEERPSDPGIRAVLARATFGLAAAGCEVVAAGEPVTTGDSPWRGLPVQQAGLPDRPAGWISRTSESLAWLREHRWGRAEETLARELDELMERCGK